MKTISLAIATCAALTRLAAAAATLITGDSNNNVHQNDSTLHDLSADGDSVLFASGPPVSGSTPGIAEGGLYVRRISTNTLTFVSDNAVSAPVEASFSDNGRYVCWRGVDSHVYWRDSVSDITRDITPSADGASRRPVMSADGRYVAYASVARNLVSNSSKLQANGRAGVYLYDSSTQTTTVVSLGQNNTALNTGITSAAGTAAAGNEFDFSADGKYIVFSSDATNAHGSRPNNYPAGFLCVYRRHLATGAVDLLNRDSGGDVADGNFTTPRISANGARVAFVGGFVGLSNIGRMIPGVTNTFGSDIYAKDVATGGVWRVSRTTDNSNPDGVFSSYIAMSGDGQTVSFGSTGTRFVAENTDPTPGNSGTFDLFRADLAGSSVSLSLVTRSPNNSGNVDFRVGPLLPGNGDYTAFSTSQVAAMLGTGSNDSIFFQGFAVSAPPVTLKPEISLQQPKGSELKDGSAKKSFGTVKVGKTAAKTFTIRNAGSATLKNLAVSKAGADKADFLITQPGKSSLAPGASTTFKVTFKPRKKGAKAAAIKVSSNDANENPFDVKLSGLGK